MLPGHMVDKVFLCIGVLFVLAGLLGVKMPASERAPTVLTGLCIAFLTLPRVVPLSSFMEYASDIVSIVAVWSVPVLRWRRRRPGGTAA